jgi:hypothetical protein
MKSCSSKQWESDVVAHFYGGTARRLTTGSGQDQSGAVVGAVAEAGAGVVVAQQRIGLGLELDAMAAVKQRVAQAQ